MDVQRPLRFPRANEVRGARACRSVPFVPAGPEEGQAEGAGGRFRPQWKHVPVQSNLQPSSKSTALGLPQRGHFRSAESPEDVGGQDTAGEMSFEAGRCNYGFPPPAGGPSLTERLETARAFLSRVSSLPRLKSAKDLRTGERALHTQTPSAALTRWYERPPSASSSGTLSKPPWPGDGFWRPPKAAHPSFSFPPPSPFSPQISS